MISWFYALLMVVLAAFMVVAYFRETASAGRIKADEGVRLERSTRIGNKLSAGELVVTETLPISLPPTPRKERKPQAEKRLSVRETVREEENLSKLDERFSKGEIEIEDYLRKHQELVRQLQSKIFRKGQKKDIEVGNEELEVLRLLSEKKTVMEIALRLLIDPDQVKRTINDLVNRGFLNLDLSLTKKGVEKLFG